jgi:cytochrome d ubiquinol oxidase subunit II
VILAVAALAVLGLVAYAVFGGADFGGGVWDLFASGPRKDEQRAAIARAMGPVWEANHVWLIFAVVIVFSCFPSAFAAVSVALFAPMHLVLVGVVLRGAAFVFRAYGAPEQARRFGALFGGASVVTPLLLGAAAASLSSGAIRVRGDAVEAPVRAWLGLGPLAFGALALALCAYQAAVFLCVETEGALREDFRARALLSGTAVVAASALVPVLLYAHGWSLLAGLASARALPVIVLGVVAAITSGLALRARWWRLARAASAAHVGALVAGWALAMHPYLVFPDVTLAGSAAPEATMRFVLVATPFGMLLLLPSIALLFRVFKSAPTGASDAAEH